VKELLHTLKSKRPKKIAWKSSIDVSINNNVARDADNFTWQRARRVIYVFGPS